MADDGREKERSRETSGRSVSLTATERRALLQAMLRENHVTPADARKEARTGPEAARAEEMRRVPFLGRYPKKEKR